MSWAGPLDEPPDRTPLIGFGRVEGQGDSIYAKLRKRHLGFLDSRILERAVEDRALSCLTLALNKEIDSCHRSPVLDLDLDLPESRFLLSAGAFGQIGLYDLCSGDRHGWCDSGRIGSGGRGSGFHVLPLRVFHQLGPRESVLPTVTRAQWYPFDSGMFFSASVDGRVTLWQPESAESVFCWNLDEAAVNDLHISPVAAHCLVAAAAGPSIRLCDLRTQTSTHQLQGHADTLMAVRWSPSNEYLLASGSRDQTIRLWDIRRPLPLFLFDQDNNQSSAAGAATGPPSRVAGAPRGSAASPVFLSHDASVNHLEFAPDGEFLISSDTAGQIWRWDVRAGHNTLIHYPRLEMLLRQPKHPLSVRRRFSISACGRFLFVPSTNRVVVIRTQTGRVVRELGGHLRSVRCVVASRRVPDLYSGSSDRSILVWSPAAGASRRSAGSGRRRRDRLRPPAQPPPAAAAHAAGARHRQQQHLRAPSISSSELSLDISEEDSDDSDDHDAVWRDD